MLSYPSPDANKLVFGSQILNFNRRLAEELRYTLVHTPSLEWIAQVILNLPQQWQIITEAIPRLQEYPGLDQLNGLAEWIRTGDVNQIAFPPENVILTPLVIVTHLAQYGQFLEVISPNDPQWSNLHRMVKQHCEVIGICIGELSAAAILASSNRKEFEEYGAAAINIAMAIGAFGDGVDLEIWKSFVVHYSKDAGDTLSATMALFPQAYISVVLDDGKTTLTAHESDLPEIAKKLNEVGITVIDIPFRGAFHWPGHTESVEALLDLVRQHDAFKLPMFDGELLGCKIARYIITETSDWPAKLAKSTWSDGALVIAFGSAATVPPSLATKLGVKLLWQILGFNIDVNSLSAPFRRLVTALQRLQTVKGDDCIAVVGMAVRTAGAQDVDEFWDLLCNGPSQHIPLSPERHDHKNEWEEEDFDKQSFASFISDADCFDHKFFKKTPRECAAMDPQHRLMLETTYQTLESAGYFSKPAEKRDPKVGCYLGIGLAEYERNVSTHPATAFAVTGNITAFAAGKIGHQFGWTGPCLAINTACSSSSVAVDLACKAVLSGECNAALAAGVNLICRSEWFNFLGAGSFLSPTGQCKPFDQDADGYCRGEGVGAVYLKKLSSAIEEGDNILGVIAASRCLHNQNTNIVAPSATSLSELFQTVLIEAGLQSKQISVVEAHGTGTQIGDTAEYDSIRKVLGGPTRENDLYLGAVKGLVGHTECASGILSLIKVLSNLHHGAIPPHFSFQTINPALNSTPDDHININLHKTAWSAPRRIAMVNNYGASGSNVAQVIVESPRTQSNSMEQEHALLQKYPFWLCGFDNESIVRYADRLLKFLKQRGHEFSLRSLSYQLARQSNRSLGQALVFTCSSLPELKGKLQEVVNRRVAGMPMKNAGSSSRPVILCFGGQTSRTVGVDRTIYESCTIFRKHLDACDQIFRETMGMPSMYPEIFQETAYSSIVTLQTRLFAIQYASAKAWIESGVLVAGMIGHSFGELTAMCVSGVFSLPDMIRLIVRRAKVIEESWIKRGAMLAVDGDVHMIEKLIQNIRKNGDAIDIACINGPTSLTLSGSTSAIQAAKHLASVEGVYASLKVKALDVTHAFHSSLVEHLLPELATIESDVVWRKQLIHMERAVEDATSAMPSIGLISQHLRNPVYFYQAAKRLYERFPDSVWLEAGSNSGVTTMAKYSLGLPQSCHFQPANVSPNQSSRCLADVTSSLWEQGINIDFWGHHPSEAANMPHIPLPPYQFEKSSHWTKAIRPVISKEPTQSAAVEEPETLWTFMGFEDAAKRHARFRVNAKSKKCQKLVAAHVVAQTAAVWPSILQMVMAIDGIQSLVKSRPHPELRPQIQRMENHSAHCINITQDIWLHAERLGEGDLNWTWKIVGGDAKLSTPKMYVSANLNFRQSDDPEYQMSFEAWERMVDIQRIHALLDDREAEGAIHGRQNIYKLFKEYINYQDDWYKNLHELGGKSLGDKGYESAGRVVAHGLDGFTDILSLIEPVGQVAGMYLNAMIERESDDMVIAHGFGNWFITPEKMEKLPTRLEVYGRHRPSEKGYTSDLFAFDQETGRLYMVVLGIRYDTVPKAVLRKILNTLSNGEDAKLPKAVEQIKAATSAPTGIAVNKHVRHDSGISLPDQPTATRNVESDLRGVFSSLLGVETTDIKIDSDLADLGVDSLMVMELVRDIEKEFELKIDIPDVIDITDFRTLLEYIHGRLGISTPASNVSSKTIANDVLRTSRLDSDARTLVNEEPSRWDHSRDDKASPDLSSLPESTMDSLIVEGSMANYLRDVEPKLQGLCAAYISEAFERLGHSLQNTKPNERMQRLPSFPDRVQHLNVLYGILEGEDLIQMVGTDIVRTDKPLSTVPADETARIFLRDYPEHALDCELIRLIGSQLASFIGGETDGVQMTFGLRAGKKLLADWYEKSPSNWPYVVKFGQNLMHQVRQITRTQRTVKILEIGGGTGGTTRTLIRNLTDAKASFQYTFTDISPAFVTSTKNAFRGNQRMEFRVLDAENPPQDMLQQFDIVVTTNCLHATHNLKETVENIKSLLRPDGVAMILEMTMNLRWVNYVFGVFDGWWLFDDGRPSALSTPAYWKETFDATGFSLIDQSCGDLPESGMQTIFTAQAREARADSVISSPKSLPQEDSLRRSDLEKTAETYVAGFLPPSTPPNPQSPSSEHLVLLTGATGSLGAHLVEYLANQEGITKVVCLNRKGKMDPEARQAAALEDKDIFLSPKAAAKTTVFESDTSEPTLGLSNDDYAMLVRSTSFIVHNAWPLNVKRGLDGFDAQFKTMRNLLDLARECASQRPGLLTFQFVSSTAAQIYDSDVPNLPEIDATDSNSPPPWGYGSAKLVCETMLKETLMKFPDFFKAMIVRIGQISGSKQTGYWNRREHLPVILKSAQAVGALPQFDGELSWSPLDDVAAICGELLLSNSTDCQLYYVENPSRLRWQKMNVWLAHALKIPLNNIIPLEDWISRVRELSLTASFRDNPAAQLLDHLSAGFIPAHCGMSILDTMQSEAHSATLRGLQPMSEDLVVKYIDAWRRAGFLS